MTFLKEEDGGGGEGGESNGETSTTSVANIASYRSILLKKAIKRKNIYDVNQEDYDKILKDSEEETIKSYKADTPCLFKCNNKYILMGEK